MKTLFIFMLLLGCGDFDPDCLNGCNSPETRPAPGIDGANDVNGRNAAPCTVNEAGLVSCPDGSSYQIPASIQGNPGIAGASGTSGATGAVGSPGPSGGSCHVQQLSKHQVRLYCDDGTEVTFVTK